MGFVPRPRFQIQVVHVIQAPSLRALAAKNHQTVACVVIPHAVVVPRWGGLSRTFLHVPLHSVSGKPQQLRGLGAIFDHHTAKKVHIGAYLRECEICGQLVIGVGWSRVGWGGLE